MIRRLLAAALAVLATGTVAVVLQQPEPATAEPRGREPVVIGHRGASAHRPEHTLLSYETAIALGADYIEPDLVSTKDHVLVARHENEIGGTTDVENHPEFAARRTTKTIDGTPITGWFTEDFTLAELKTLRAEERIPDLRPGNTAFNGLAEIPTFDEVVALAKRSGVGVYPETKHPSYFDSIGLSLEEPLLDVLGRHGWRGSRDPVFIQSFETANLRELSKRTRLPLIQLVTATGAPYDWVAAGDPRTYDTMVTPAGLRDVAGYADGVGVDTRRIVPTGPRRPPPAAHLVHQRRPPGRSEGPHLDREERELAAPGGLPAREPGEPCLPARHRRRDGLAGEALLPRRRRRLRRRRGHGQRRQGARLLASTGPAPGYGDPYGVSRRRDPVRVGDAVGRRRGRGRRRLFPGTRLSQATSTICSASSMGRSSSA
ncbi:glycerophosphodiester phosphodiesterase family protein [Streptosporangium vulgare]|uniref:glycerophosphodiester phosphodiesterase family protein n=1 Tax=Streptosporangium vulgare TaxID=46190 RepID=UPI003376A0B3